MRERIKFNRHQYLIYVDLEFPSTLQRRALEDAIFLRDSGADVALCIPRKGPLLKGVEFFDLNYYLIPEFKSLIGQFWWHWRVLKKIIQERDLDMVISYSEKGLFPLLASLVRFSKISLVFVANKVPDLMYSKFKIPRVLTRRLDLLIVTHDDLRLSCSHFFKINPFKVTCLGLGIPQSIRSDQEGENHSEAVKVINIGSFLNYSNPEGSLKLILYSLPQIINKLNISPEKLQINIYINELVYSHEDLRKLNVLLSKMSEDLGLINYVNLVPLSFYSLSMDVFKQFNFYLSVEDSEALNDFELIAILRQIPILVPRHVGRVSLIDKKRQVGETYKFQDSRELSHRLYQLHNNIDHYQEHLRKHLTFFEEKYSETSYFDRFTNLLEIQLHKRAILVVNKT